VGGVVGRMDHRISSTASMISGVQTGHLMLPHTFLQSFPPEINYAGATLTSTEKRNDEIISIGERCQWRSENVPITAV